MSLKAQVFDFNQNCKTAYQEIFKLKLENGKKILTQEKTENTTNIFPYFLENYIDFFKVFISEDVNLYNQFAKNVDTRIATIKKADKKSPYYLYTQAEIHLQLAICKLKFSDYVSSAFEVKKAYNLLLENQKKYPDFKANLKSIGLLHTVFGAIPDKYKFAAKMLGLKGSIEQGTKEMQTVINDKSFIFRDEAIIMFAFLQLHLNNKEKNVWDILDNNNLPLENNLMNHFIVANIASHTGKNDKVIDVLNNYPKNKDFYPFPYLDYMLGIAKLNQLNISSNIQFKNYINQQKNKSYIKESYRKLAWIELLNNNENGYKKQMQNVLKFGTKNTDEDKAAQKEAEENSLPNKNILIARLLFDGAYYQKSLETLNKIADKELTTTKDKIEFLYRKARAFEKLNKLENATATYQKTIEIGEKFSYYFTANACVKLATILENKNKKSAAIIYYKKAITLEKDQYENSINAEAKAGLNRLEK